MSIYVVDTNVFSHSLKNLMPFDVFDSFWLPWSDGMKNGTIISVDEVYNELDNLWGAENPKKNRIAEGEWLKIHRNYFLGLTEAEGHIVAEIYKSKKFQEGVKERSLREGTPEADAILVAKAKSVGGIVVTNESNDKPNSEKIPNICVSLGVPYIKKEDFYRVLKNIHSGCPEHDGVTVYYTLQVESELEEEIEAG